MKLGTIAYNNKIYNLNYIETEDLKQLIKKMKLDNNVKKDQLAILNWLYTKRLSDESINTKVNHQLNSMKNAIEKINSKFILKSKNYEKIEENIENLLNQYESNLKKICNAYDVKIHEFILKKYEKEKVLEGENDKEIIFKLNTDIKKLTSQINKLNEQKIQKVYSAMESENKSISTQIKKVHAFKNIKKFFVNKFNTYNTVIKNVIKPLEMRIEKFNKEKLKKYMLSDEPLTLEQFKQKIK